MSNQQNLGQNLPPTSDKPVEGFMADMVRNGIGNKFIENAKKLAERLKNDGLTNSQIRRIYGHIKKIENSRNPNEFIPRLLMLKPLLEYTSKRHKPVEKLKDCLIEGIDAVVSASTNEEGEEIIDRFRRFCLGFEAILAYHYGK